MANQPDPDKRNLKTSKAKPSSLDNLSFLARLAFLKNDRLPSNWNAQIPDKAEVHRRVARGLGAEGLEAIWEEELSQDPIAEFARQYAREHFLTHVYHGGEYQKLLAILNEGSYGRAKLRHYTNPQPYC